MSIEGIQIVSVPVTDQDAAKRFSGPIREAPWGRFATFSDPDGNGWVLQQNAA